jgi:hypothetical protein
MENIEAMLCAYVEGDLDEAGRAQIEKHLQSNPQHRKLLDDLVQMKEMVRGLPRVKAPMDVGDSLRQKVERSMLLEDAAVVRPTGGQVDRWPQMFAIAAMFLLVSALCFIVYRALAPTLKPAQFTQVGGRFQAAPDAVFALKADDVAGGARREADKDQAKGEAVDSPTINSTGTNALAVNSAAANSPASNSQESAILLDQKVASAPGAPPAVTRQLASRQQAAMQQLAAQAASPIVAPQQQNLSQTQQGLMQLQKSGLAQVDLVAIRRRLQSFGYQMDQTPSKNNGATLVLVNSNDLPATKQQITQFLNNNNGVSWNAVPEDVEGQNRAQMPGGLGGSGGNTQGENAGSQFGPSQVNAAADVGGAAMQPMGLNERAVGNLQAKLRATTEPSSDVYVARGLTPQQVDALRQTLSLPQNGSAVQVEVKSVNDLSASESPATQPTVVMPKDVNVMGLANAGVANGGATTQPSETANAGVDLAAPAATMPSAGGIAQADRDRSVVTNAATLQSVDAVIVLQPTATVMGTASVGGGSLGSVSSDSAGATTQPESGAMTPAGMAVPATQPESAPTTQP